MRYIILLACCFLLSLEVSAQSIEDTMLIGKRIWRVPQLPTDGNQIAYKGEVEMPGSSQQALYTRAYYWLKQNLKSDDLDMRVNKQKGHIAGKGKITYNQNVVANNAAQGIYFDYDLFVRDNSYSYNLSNLRATIPGGSIDYSAMYQEELNKGDGAGQWTHKYRYEMLSDLHSFITLFIQGLQSNMAAR
jgi:hypothetical protein